MRNHKRERVEVRGFLRILGLLDMLAGCSCVRILMENIKGI